VSASRRILPHGSWPSPIAVETVVARGRSVFAPWLDGDDLYVQESRPEEGGRDVILRRGPDGRFTDVTPTGANVRSRVHEYGGGAYTVSGGLVVFSEFADRRLYRQRTPASVPEALTASGDQRFADLVVDAPRGRVVAVLEDHAQGLAEPRNALAAVNLAGGAVITLVEGRDFFSDPRLDRTGRWLCWLAWDRPAMPWDAAELWVGAVAPDGSVRDATRVAGSATESIVGPTWAPDGSLLFSSDRDGWGNVYRRRPDGTIHALAPMEAEVGGGRRAGLGVRPAVRGGR
jgi:hypothetical protein